MSKQAKDLTDRVRQTIKGMKPKDQISYLLGVLDSLAEDEARLYNQQLYVNTTLPMLDGEPIEYGVTFTGELPQEGGQHE